MPTLEEFKQDFALLFEAGLIAVKQGDEDGAKKVFDALGVLDPVNSGKDTGYGLVALHKMDLETAREYFEKLIEKDSENWSVAAFLSLTYMLSVMKQGNSFEFRRNCLEKSFILTERILKECQVKSTRDFASSLQDWHKALAEKSSGPLG